MMMIKRPRNKEQTVGKLVNLLVQSGKLCIQSAAAGKKLGMEWNGSVGVTRNETRERRELIPHFLYFSRSGMDG